jgi:hypothetical protein
MRAHVSHSTMTSVATSCSVVAAASFAALPILSAVSPSFNPAHPWIFSLGALAFISNLKFGLHPMLTALAALVQAVCVFELLGFSVAVSLITFAGSGRWLPVDWWVWLAMWGLLSVCVSALICSTVVRRAVHTP